MRRNPPYLSFCILTDGREIHGVLSFEERMVVRVALVWISHLLLCDLGYINFIILPLLLGFIINLKPKSK